jgi:hypothetical protein
MRQKAIRISSAVLFILLVLIIGSLLGLFGYLYGKNNASKSKQTPFSQTSLNPK